MATVAAIRCPSCREAAEELTPFCPHCGAIMNAPSNSSLHEAPTQLAPPSAADRVVAWAAVPAAPSPAAQVPPPAPAAQVPPPPVPPAPTPAAQMPPPPVPPTAVPAAHSVRGERSDRPILVGLGAGALLIAILLLTGLYVGGVFSSPSAPVRVTAVPVAAPASHSAATRQAAPPASVTRAPARVAPPVTHTPPRVAPSLLSVPAPSSRPPGIGVTGQDASGYNIGPGCSDDPSSTLPGCSDSPSTPNGDPETQCANGITVDQQTTSCGIAENVYYGYSGDGSVLAHSPVTGGTYAFTCQTGGAGTTGMTICEATAGAATLYLRWHR